MSEIELLSWERGKIWRVSKPFIVTDRHGRQLQIRAGFRHDRYTFAPDLPDERPAVTHDFAYDPDGAERVWADGSPITRSQADILLYDQMRASPDRVTRNCAKQYYKWVRRLGGPVWAWGSLKMLLRNR